MPLTEDVQRVVADLWQSWLDNRSIGRTARERFYWAGYAGGRRQAARQLAIATGLPDPAEEAKAPPAMPLNQAQEDSLRRLLDNVLPNPTAAQTIEVLTDGIDPHLSFCIGHWLGEGFRVRRMIIEILEKKRGVDETRPAQEDPRPST